MKLFPILDRFSEAYIAETGLCPSQCELIEEVPQLVGKDFKTKYYFRKRKESHEIALNAYKDAFNLVSKYKVEMDSGNIENPWAKIFDELHYRIKKIKQMKKEDS